VDKADKTDVGYEPDDIDPSYESYKGNSDVSGEPDPVIELDMTKAAESFELEVDKYEVPPDDEITADDEEVGEFDKYDGTDPEAIEALINDEVDELIEDESPSEDEIADLDEDLDISEIDKVLKNA
jgi:hypothetical protein